MTPMRSIASPSLCWHWSHSPIRCRRAILCLELHNGRHCAFHVVHHIGRLEWRGFFPPPSFMVDVLTLPICAAIAIVVVKNFRILNPWSVAGEVIFGAIAFPLFVYTTMTTMLAAALSPPGNSGPPLDVGLFVRIFFSHPTELLMKAFAVGSVVSVILLASWEMRYRFHTHTSLFKIVRARFALILEQIGARIGRHWILGMIRS